MADTETTEDANTEPHLPLTVDSPIAWAEFLIDHKALHAYYKEHGVRCFDCCAAEAETFAQGAKVHEGGPHGTFDPEKVVAELNKLAKEQPFDEANYVKPTIFKRIVDVMFSSSSPTDGR